MCVDSPTHGPQGYDAPRLEDGLVCKALRLEAKPACGVCMMGLEIRLTTLNLPLKKLIGALVL